VSDAASRDRLLFGAAIVVGAAGWAWAGGKEAWDLPPYWSVVLPLSYGSLFLFGTLGSRSAWRWPVLVFGTQLATMLLRGGFGSMAPFGVLLFAILATFGLVPAYLGVALRRWRQRRLAARFAAEARKKAFITPET
jgi:hypothetical protein